MNLSEVSAWWLAFATLVAVGAFVAGLMAAP
jgi:hypothetical protein